MEHERVPLLLLSAGRTGRRQPGLHRGLRDHHAGDRTRSHRQRQRARTRPQPDPTPKEPTEHASC
eukprot:6653805-Pyramimonas_sp.AAC.1